MITQREFVEGCLRYYAENYYQQGNSEDGQWDICHYPVPKCKGGTETILLLRQHHAIQGLLQSEEFDHPCIGFWEQDYLPESYLTLLNKWRAKMKELAWEGQWGTKTKEERRAKCKHLQGAVARRKRIEIITPEARYEFPSIAAASAELGVPAQTISQRLNHPNGRGDGKRKTHFKKPQNNFLARYL